MSKTILKKNAHLNRKQEEQRIRAEKEEEKRIKEEKREEELKKQIALCEMLKKSAQKHLRKLNKRLCFIYTRIKGEHVVVAIVDPKLRAKFCPYNENYLIGGSKDYSKLGLKSSCGKKGICYSNNYVESYTVSTDDGSNFTVVDNTGKPVLEFTSMNTIPTLVLQSISNCVFDQFCYCPTDVKSDSDENTKKFHEILKEIVEEDAKLAEENPAHVRLSLK